MEGKRYPKIRFKGFSDAWVQRRFDDLFSFPILNNSFSRDKLNYENGEVLNIHYGDILIKYGAILDVKIDKVPYIKGSSRKEYFNNNLHNGDVVFADAAEDLTVGKAIEIFGVTNEIIVSGLHTIVARFKEEKSQFFMGYYINSNKYRKQLMRLIQGSKISSINKSNLRQTIINFPCNLKEQSQIGNFFREIDSLIALYQRKIQQLNLLKKEYLKGLFPQKDSKNPKYRFRGFNDAWEQEKLGKVLIEFSDKSKKENEYRVLSSTNVGMEPRDGRVSGQSNIGYKIIDNGDLVLSPQNLWLGNININSIGKGLVSPSYKTFKFKNIDLNFVKPQLRTPKMMENYKNASTQGASVVRRNLDVELFEQIIILIPTQLEQQQIGAFFNNLDHLITLHQRKLDSLIKIKKYYLNNMFI